MRGIFPIVQPVPNSGTSAAALPMCREVAWDFERGKPLFSAGRPLVVSGAEAVRVWIWKALNTARFRHDIYTWDFGCEAEELVGKPFTPAVKESEAVRYVKEALEPNPYITDVRQVDVTFSGTELTISCAVSTIYGEVQVDV